MKTNVALVALLMLLAACSTAQNQPQQNERSADRSRPTAKSMSIGLALSGTDATSAMPSVPASAKALSLQISANGPAAYKLDVTLSDLSGAKLAAATAVGQGFDINLGHLTPNSSLIISAEVSGLGPDTTYLIGSGKVEVGSNGMFVASQVVTLAPPTNNSVAVAFPSSQGPAPSPSSAPGTPGSCADLQQQLQAFDAATASARSGMLAQQKQESDAQAAAVSEVYATEQNNMAAADQADYAQRVANLQAYQSQLQANGGNAAAYSNAVLAANRGHQRVVAADAAQLAATQSQIETEVRGLGTALQAQTAKFDADHTVARATLLQKLQDQAQAANTGCNLK